MDEQRGEFDWAGGAWLLGGLGQLPLIVWAAAADGTLLAVEGAALAVIGLDAAELRGRRIQETFAELPSVIESFERGLSGKQEVESTEVGGRVWHTRMRRVESPEGGGEILLGLSIDVTNQVETDREVAKRGEILEAVSGIAHSLLSDALVAEPPERLLEPVAIATGASRVYLFENHPGEDGRRLMSQRWERVAPGVEPQIDNPEMLNLPWDTPGLDEMGSVLERGDVYSRHSRDVASEFRAILESQDICSVLIVPVFTGGRWWGFVGFDECRRERHWSRAEIDALRIGADLFGAYLERRRLDREMRESEAKYRELFENASDLFWAIDLEGRFTTVNRAFAETLGYAVDDILMRPWEDFITEPDQREVVRAALREKLEQGREQTRYEVRLRHGDGHFIEVEVSSRAVVREGRPVGVHGTGRDISDRRRLEGQLRQAVKMEAVGRLAAGVAREFSHLVSAINGYGERVLVRLGPTDPMRAEVTEILRVGGRAADLTRELLAFGRQQPARPTRVDVNALISRRIPTLRRIVGEEVNVVDLTDERVGRINADPGLVEQVLVNLFVNARDAMPEGGRIELSTAVVASEEITRRGIAPPPDTHFVKVSIRDTGHGMDSTTLPRIFEPFFTTRERGRGSGLGLSSVYGIVKQCDGYVFADSHPGQGTVFHVYLPQAEAAGTPRRPSGEIRPTEISAESADRSELVMLVEDEELIRNLAEQILIDRGYRVITAANANDALELAGSLQGEIDLLLTDIVMPGLSGLDLAQRLRRRLPRLRVLFMSGYSDSPLLRAGLAAEGAAFLQKPFSAEALERRVRELLDAPSSPRRR